MLSLFCDEQPSSDNDQTSCVAESSMPFFAVSLVDVQTKHQITPTRAVPQQETTAGSLLSTRTSLSARWGNASDLKSSGDKDTEGRRGFALRSMPGSFADTCL